MYGFVHDSRDVLYTKGQNQRMSREWHPRKEAAEKAPPHDSENRLTSALCLPITPIVATPVKDSAHMMKRVGCLLWQSCSGHRVRQQHEIVHAAKPRSALRCSGCRRPSTGKKWPGTKTASAAETNRQPFAQDRKSTRLNSSHHSISYAVFCL